MLSLGTPTIPLPLSHTLRVTLIAATLVPPAQFGCQFLRSLCTWFGGMSRGHCGRAWGRGAGSRRADSGRPRDLWVIFVRVGKIHRLSREDKPVQTIEYGRYRARVLRVSSWKCSKLSLPPEDCLGTNSQAIGGANSYYLSTWLLSIIILRMRWTSSF